MLNGEKNRPVWVCQGFKSGFHNKVNESAWWAQYDSYPIDQHWQLEIFLFWVGAKNYSKCKGNLLQVHFSPHTLVTACLCILMQPYYTIIMYEFLPYMHVALKCILTSLLQVRTFKQLWFFRKLLTDTAILLRKRHYYSNVNNNNLAIFWCFLFLHFPPTRTL